MSYMSLGGITLAIAVIAIFAIGFLSYMSNLLKSAYQLKVEMRAELDDGLKKIEEEMGKKSRWMRSEVGDDVNKMKSAVQQDNDRRLKEITESLQAIVRELETATAEERADLRQMLRTLGQKVAALEASLGAMKEEMERRAAIGRRRVDHKAEPVPERPAETKAAAEEDDALLLEDQVAASPTMVGDVVLPAPPVVQAVPAAAVGGVGAGMPVQRMPLTDFGEKK